MTTEFICHRLPLILYCLTLPHTCARKKNSINWFIRLFMCMCTVCRFSGCVTRGCMLRWALTLHLCIWQTLLSKVTYRVRSGFTIYHDVLSFGIEPMTLSLFALFRRLIYKTKNFEQQINLKTNVNKYLFTPIYVINLLHNTYLKKNQELNQ